jgi:T5SS/PEP-CTERM-associated repeat protein
LIAGGELDVGETGVGGLLLENQATVITGTIAVSGAQGLDISETAGGTGDTIVTGIGSLLDNTGDMIVGDDGLGSLSIQSKGSVITTPGTVVGLAGAVIANQAGASGSAVNVVGAGSNWRVGGKLVVGNAGEGLLNIAAGATVSAATLDVGSRTDGAGLVSISGDNSSLAVTGTVSVGSAGSGELSILSGANVNIGGDFDIGQTSGGTGDVDIEDPTGTVFLGGNLNLGDGAAGVLTVGPNSTLEVDNGGVIAGPHGVENLFSAIDPFFSDGGTATILDSADQIYKAYVESTSFNLSPGISYTLNTPIIYGSSGFALGVNSSDSSGVELILNADSLSTASNVTFNDALSTLVIGADVLPSIELPASGTGPFTAAANPNLGLPLIGGFDGTIRDFQVGDTITVDTKVAATFHQNGSLVLVIANTTTLGALTFDSLANATLALITPGALVDQAPCFAAGTRIATDRGEVAVEDLRVGDLVRTVLGGGVIARSEATRQSPSNCAAVRGLLRFARNDNGAHDSGEHDSAMPAVPESPCAMPLRDEPIGDALAPIIWVGRREIDCAQHPKPRTVWPVRVSAGAFGPGQPHTDLLLSPDHAVYVGEVLIPVKHLINGSTIAQVPMDSVVYHHIELPQHDVLLAQGLPAESFLDMRDGTNCANRRGPVRLYPDYSVLTWEAFGCARLIVAGPELATARALLAGFAQTQAAA